MATTTYDYHTCVWEDTRLLSSGDSTWPSRLAGAMRYDIALWSENMAHGNDGTRLLPGGLFAGLGFRNNVD